MNLPLKKTVATPSAEYTRSATRWALPRTLMGGTRAMRAAGRTYLPQEPAESDDAYDCRLKRTALFNAFRKTVRDMAGKVFAKPIAIGEDVPDQLREFAENIDLAGRNLDVFAHQVFVDALSSGIGFILVDMPPAQGDATRADEKAAGRRPYLVHVCAEALIGWKSEVINGQETLTQVRIKESVTEPDPASPYEDRVVEQVRVLERGTWQIFRKSENPQSKDEWILHASGVSSVIDITLVPVYLNRTGFMMAEPPLEDLADLNVAHWQSQSDQRNILHVARVPILFCSGIPDAAKMVVGVNSLSRASDPNAKLVYVEHSGQAIGSGREDLKDLELAMQAMGLQLLIPKPGQTATGEVRDDVKENSPLAMMARALQDALEQAFGFMAEFIGLGEDAGGSLTVNTDFGIASHDVTDQNTLLAAAGSGLITHETWIREMQRRGVIADDLDPEEEIKQLAAALEVEDEESLRPGEDARKEEAEAA